MKSNVMEFPHVENIGGKYVSLRDTLPHPCVVKLRILSSTHILRMFRECAIHLIVISGVGVSNSSIDLKVELWVRVALFNFCLFNAMHEAFAKLLKNITNPLWPNQSLRSLCQL